MNGGGQECPPYTRIPLGKPQALVRSQLGKSCGPVLTRAEFPATAAC
jgi:hypothetical protein